MPSDAIGLSSCADRTARTLAHVRLLEALAAAFINTFGITQPTAEARRRAAWFILGLLIVMFAVVCTVGYLFYTAMHH